MANDCLDIVIFGATGFTGQYAVKYATHFCKEWQLKFGIAGRNKEALEDVLKEFAIDTRNVPIILADIYDEESLKKMTKRAKVIINCCGPYKFYGEQVIKACIATRTNYVDVSAETEFLETTQLLYNKAAQDAGIYIVGACGVDSIPVDLGIIFTQQKFGGDVNSIETYGQIEVPKYQPIANYGTWKSAIHVIADWSKLKKLHAKLYPNRLPNFTPKLEPRGFVHKSEVVDGWSIVFPGCDRSVAIRTQRFLYDQYKQRPAQVRTYMTVSSFFTLLTIFILGAVFYLMAQTVYTRKLLLKYPSLFSAGFIGRNDFTHKSMERTRFSITFKALGWSKKLGEFTEHTDPPNKELITRVSGYEPSYGTTCIVLILSAIMILKEADKIPNSGGVLTPGAAFGNTSMIEQMIKNDIKFEVIRSSEK